MTGKVSMQLSTVGFSSLIGYLTAHEDDIALGADDFHELRLVFADVFGREAKEDPGASPLTAEETKQAMDKIEAWWSRATHVASKGNETD